MRKRFLTVVGTALVAMLVLAACGSPTDDEPEPTVTRIPDAANAPVLTPVPDEAAVAEVDDATPAEAALEDEPAEDAAEEPAEEPADAADAPLTTTVVSHDIYFEPTEVTIGADTDITFILPNEGAAPHNFAIDELEIDVDIAPGATEEVVINAPAGTYEFYCNVPGHREAGMVGTLIVEN
jgi:plastocyanin